SAGGRASGWWRRGGGWCAGAGGGGGLGIERHGRVGGIGGPAWTHRAAATKKAPRGRPAGRPRAGSALGVASVHVAHSAGARAGHLVCGRDVAILAEIAAARRWTRP